MRLIGRIAAAAAMVVGSAGMTVAWAPSAGAYGKVGTLNVWQVGLSFNCNNPSVCGSDETGGFWGWVQFNQNPVTGTTDGDAEFAFCFHTVGGGGAGAGHESLEITSWTIAPGSAGPHTFYISGTETDSFRGQQETIPVVDEDSGIPADPGHYNATDVFGQTPPPGIAIQLQVAYKPAH